MIHSGSQRGAQTVFSDLAGRASTSASCMSWMAKATSRAI